MNDVPFHLTKAGRMHYEVTLPNLVRELHRLNDLLALAVELMEKKTEDDGDDRPGEN